MSANRFVFTGLDELKKELRTLPADLASEGLHAAEASANASFVQIKTVYQQHRFTGKLANMLTIGSNAKGYTVRSNSPLAWLFDNGSQARHWDTGKSTGKMWGHTPMPPLHIFSGTMARERRRFAAALKAIVERHGLTVKGDA